MLLLVAAWKTFAINITISFNANDKDFRYSLGTSQHTHSTATDRAKAFYRFVRALVDSTSRVAWHFIQVRPSFSPKQTDALRFAKITNLRIVFSGKTILFIWGLSVNGFMVGFQRATKPAKRMRGLEDHRTANRNWWWCVAMRHAFIQLWPFITPRDPQNANQKRSTASGACPNAEWRNRNMQLCHFAVLAKADRRYSFPALLSEAHSSALGFGARSLICFDYFKLKENI